MLRSRRKLLGRVELDPAIEKQLEDTGLLEVHFATRKADTSMLSLDGNRTIAWMAPSGELAGLLVQDYHDGVGTRVIPFAFGELELVNDGAELSVFLRTRTT